MEPINWPQLIKEACIAAFAGTLILIIIGVAAKAFFAGMFYYFRKTDEKKPFKMK